MTGRAIFACPYVEVLYVRLGLPQPSSNAMASAKTTQLTTKDDVLQKLASQGLHGKAWRTSLAMSSNAF